jgi:hypothetical protein
VRTFPILLALALTTGAWASEASKLYNEARKAEKAGQVARAYLLYSEAAALEPDNHLYWGRSLALQTGAALQQSKATPPVAPAEAVALAADSPKGDAAAEADEPALIAATAQDLAEARKPLPPTKLSAAPGLKDFSLRANAKTLFETVARAYGLDCVFDGGYQATQILRFQMDQADLRSPFHGGERYCAKAKRGGALRGGDRSRAGAHHDTGSDRHDYRRTTGVRHPEGLLG